FEYDKNGNYLGYSNTPVGGNGEVEFIAQGHRLRFRSTSYDDIKPSDVGVHTLPTLEGRDSNNNFTVYNAGNVTIEPESMFLRIIASYVNSPGNFTIRNKTTGDEFVLKRASSGYHVRLIGMIPSLGGITNIFRDTNRRFIRLAPGANEFEVLNGSFTQISIDFKYYYK